MGAIEIYLSGQRMIIRHQTSSNVKINLAIDGYYDEEVKIKMEKHYTTKSMTKCVCWLLNIIVIIIIERD